MKAIGGYFELELYKGNLYHRDALALNSGKNCLEYLLMHQQYTKVYMPYFTCAVVYMPFEKLNIPYELYNIDWNLEPVNLPILKEGEAFLYTNYFGLKDECVAYLAEKYGNQLIVDNAQAFFAKPLRNINTFYSPRKFVGIPDGGYLYTTSAVENQYENFKQSTSHNRIGHLVKRIDLSPEDAYIDFKAEDESLANEPIQRMSRLTTALLASIDYKMVQQQRRENFIYLHENLKKSNKLSLNISMDAVPMVYPLYIDNAQLIRKRLLAEKIYCATYWPNVLKYCKKNSLEYKLTSNIIPLPIDQRYGEEEMMHIVDIICKSQK